MGVIQAKIQTVEDIDRLVRTAVVSKQPIAPPITVGIGGSVRIGWAGITKARSVYFAISMPGKAQVGCKRTDHQQTGAVSH